jgi:hypothetical protein
MSAASDARPDHDVAAPLQLLLPRRVLELPPAVRDMAVVLDGDTKAGPGQVGQEEHPPRDVVDRVVEHRVREAEVHEAELHAALGGRPRLPACEFHQEGRTPRPPAVGPRLDPVADLGAQRVGILGEEECLVVRREGGRAVVSAEEVGENALLGEHREATALGPVGLQRPAVVRDDAFVRAALAAVRDGHVDRQRVEAPAAVQPGRGAPTDDRVFTGEVHRRIDQRQGVVRAGGGDEHPRPRHAPPARLDRASDGLLTDVADEPAPTESAVDGRNRVHGQSIAAGGAAPQNRSTGARTCGQPPGGMSDSRPVVWDSRPVVWDSRVSGRGRPGRC